MRGNNLPLDKKGSSQIFSLSFGVTLELINSISYFIIVMSNLLGLGVRLELINGIKHIL